MRKQDKVNPFLLQRQLMNRINKLPKEKKRSFAEGIFKLLDEIERTV